MSDPKPRIYFRVAKLGDYQHYKDRRPAWVKLHRHVLESYDFGRLQDASKWLALGCILLASESENRIPWDEEWIARRLQMTTKPNLNDLLSGGFIELCDPASNLLATCYGFASLETETEREKETTGEAPPSPPAVPAVPKPKHRPSSPQPKQTWLTPMRDAWEATFGAGSFVFGIAAKSLKPLVDGGLSPDDVGKRLGAYLGHLSDQGELKFASLPRFAQVHGQYANGKPLSAKDREYEAIAAEANDVSRMSA